MLRTIVVTGTSSGIGKEIAHHLLASGFNVIGISRRTPDITHENYRHLTSDLTDSSKREELIKILRKNTSISGLVLNAGFGIFGNVEELSMKSYKDVLECNFFANVHLVKALLPHFKSLDRADILFISSKSALQGGKNGTAYCASKFAIRGFAQSLQEECSTNNVHIVSIQPGMVDTPFFDQHSFYPGDHDLEHIKAKDIAEACLFALKMRLGTVCQEITLSPLRKVVHRR